MQTVSLVVQKVCSELVKSGGGIRRADGANRPSTVCVECLGEKQTADGQLCTHFQPHHCHLQEYEFKEKVSQNKTLLNLALPKEEGDIIRKSKATHQRDVPEQLAGGCAR